jgi:hypothetical protein
MAPPKGGAFDFLKECFAFRASRRSATSLHAVAPRVFSGGGSQHRSMELFRCAAGFPVDLNLLPA